LITDLHPDAAVHTSDAVLIGHLQRVIVDAETLDLRDLVVRETRRFAGHVFAPGTLLIADEVRVPVGSVVEAAHTRVELSISAADVRRLPPYLSYAFAPLRPGDVWRMAASQVALSPSLRPLQESAAKSEQELEISRGENIMLGHTGRKLGTVKDVLFDGKEFVGVVMDPEGLFQSDVILQVRFLDRSDDLALFATLSDQDLRHLQPFTPESAR
jgi:sporulation protein YlmC with PRC-barrel domain